MMRHIVMFKFLEEAAGKTKAENLQTAKTMLEALVGVVPSLRAMNVRLAAEGQDAGNYDLVLMADFDDMQGVRDYIVHPAHRNVGSFMSVVRESRASIDVEL